MASPHDAIDLTGDSDEEEPQLAVAGPVSESGEEPEPTPREPSPHQIDPAPPAPPPPPPSDELDPEQVEAVRAVLQHERLKLGQYAENLVAAGYDDVRYMRHLTTEELRVAGREHASMKQGHAARFAKCFHEAAGGMLPDTAAAVGAGVDPAAGAGAAAQAEAAAVAAESEAEAAEARATPPRKRSRHEAAHPPPQQAGGGSAGSSESHASAAGAAGGAPLAALSSDDQEVAGRLLPFLKEHGRREEAAAAKACTPSPLAHPLSPCAPPRASRRPGSRVFPPHAHGTPAGGPAEPAAGERAARQPLRQRLPRVPLQRPRPRRRHLEQRLSPRRAAAKGRAGGRAAPLAASRLSVTRPRLSATGGAAGFISGRAARGLLSIAGDGDGDAALRELRARAEAQYRQKAVTVRVKAYGLRSAAPGARADDGTEAGEGESSHCAGHGTVRLVEFVDGGQVRLPRTLLLGAATSLSLPASSAWPRPSRPDPPRSHPPGRRDAARGCAGSPEIRRHSLRPRRGLPSASRANCPAPPLPSRRQAKQLGLDLPGIEAPANTFRIDKDFSYGPPPAPPRPASAASHCAASRPFSRGPSLAAPPRSRVGQACS